MEHCGPVLTPYVHIFQPPVLRAKFGHSRSNRTKVVMEGKF